jgi:hypothetical protein
MGRTLFFIVALTCLASLANAQSGQPDGVRAIRVIQREEGQLIRYSVVLDRRLEAAELEQLSQRIKQATPRTKLILILFFLRGMVEDRDAWAASAFNADADGFAVHIRDTNTKTNPPDADLRIEAAR